MARNFDNATGNLTKTTDAVISTVTDNFTMCAWVRFETTGVSDTIMINGFDGGSGSGYHISKSSADKPFIGLSFVVSVIGNTTLSINTWYHILGVRNAGTSRIYLNGVDDTSSSSALAPFAPATYFRIGCRTSDAGVNANFWDGDIAECAFWERVLTAAEITSLSQGFAPSFFTQNLVFYAPIIGANSPEDDRKSTTKLTVTAATRSTHPDFMKYPGKPNGGVSIRPRAFSPGLAR